MNAPSELQTALAGLLGDARLVAETLPGTDLKLWLIDPADMQRAFNPEETRRILEEPPYWCFCWASGLVLARWLAERPEWVRGKRVLDFGAGSGVAAIAAAKAGADHAPYAAHNLAVLNMAQSHLQAYRDLRPLLLLLLQRLQDHHRNARVISLYSVCPNDQARVYLRQAYQAHYPLSRH